MYSCLLHPRGVHNEIKIYDNNCDDIERCNIRLLFLRRLGICMPIYHRSYRSLHAYQPYGYNSPETTSWYRKHRVIFYLTSTTLLLL